MANQKDFGAVDIATQQCRIFLQELGHLRQHAAVVGPRALFGQINGEGVQAPGCQVHGLVAVVGLAVAITVKQDDQRRLVAVFGQVKVTGDAFTRRQLQCLVFLGIDRKRAAHLESVDVRGVGQQITFELAVAVGFEVGEACGRFFGATAQHCQYEQAGNEQDLAPRLQGRTSVATDARAGGDGGHCKNILFSGVA